MKTIGEKSPPFFNGDTMQKPAIQSKVSVPVYNALVKLARETDVSISKISFRIIEKSLLENGLISETDLEE